jgi:hypothetical protein
MGPEYIVIAFCITLAIIVFGPLRKLHNKK